MDARPLEQFVRTVSAVVDAGRDEEVPRRVAQALPRLLARPDALAPEHRAAGDEGYRQHVLYVDPAGRFSVLSLVWPPGESTPIHDHIAWCVVGVWEGEELETRYRLVDSTASPGRVVPVAAMRRRPGDVAVLLPSEAGIHRVENPTGGTAVSIHVYGADIRRAGTSIRRTYTAETR